MSNTSISVHVRLRPLAGKDGTLTSANEVLLTDRTASVPSGSKTDSSQRLKFTLDACHGAESTQEEVFERVKPIMEQVYRGINTTVFAYGVTGSGKTWTMQGSPSDPGVIPRVVKHIFQKKARLRKSSLKISFSYVEILVEEVYDLLVTRRPGDTMKKLDIRSTSTGQNVIADLTLRPISSAAEFDTCYSQASLMRKTASTNLNSSSSRSHAILTIVVETTELCEEGKTYVGKICLVDLAGSEDNNLTGNDPQRMRESSAINRSLATLGNVVEALNNGNGRIPYRDSKLTRILQDALGGSSVGMLICNLAPGDKYAKDTLRTLKFATRTREIENKPVVNERDDRMLPKPHFSQATRPGMKTSIAPPQRPLSTAARPTSANAIAGPSRPPSRPVSSTSQQHSKLGEQVRREAKEGGIALTEDQLNVRIEAIVKQVMSEQSKISEKQADVEPSTRSVAPTIDLDSLTEEEVRSRAKVLTNLARQHHDNQELELAIKYYKEAKVYMPSNDKLNRRITELELALVGQMPVPGRGGTKIVDTASPGQKRKRQPTQQEDASALTVTDEVKPRLKRSKAKISLSQIMDEKDEPALRVREMNDQPVEKSQNGKSAVLKVLNEKPKTRQPLGTKAKSGKELQPIFDVIDKENETAAPANKRVRQTRKPAMVIMDDSYHQTDDGEESDYVPEVPKRAKRKIGVRV